MEHQDDCERKAEEEEARNPPPPPPPKPPVTIRYFYPARKRKRRKQEPYIPPPKEDFISCLYLKEKPKEEPKVASPSGDVKQEEIDSDCEIVDIDMSESDTPMTPRTPKSLISQLSKEGHHGDAGSRRRHLSFSQMAANEQDSSESSDEAETSTSPDKPSLAISSLLYNIDVTSALGKRVRKHLRHDATLPIVSKPEAYCSQDRNTFTEKLRQRGDQFPCVFYKNKRRKLHCKYTHKYRFNKRDREEFMMILKTGLNRRSRHLLTEVKPCKVELVRLKPAVIREWIRRKQPQYVHVSYYQQMMIRKQQLQLQAQMQRMQVPNRNYPYLAQTLMKPMKPVVGPLSAKMKQMKNMATTNNSGPNMITKMVTNPDGTTSMRIFPGQNPMQQFRSQPSLPESRRKQNFERVRNLDDEVIIIDLSDSDEEDKPQRPQPSTSYVSQPQTMTGPRPKRKIGPACSRYGRKSPPCFNTSSPSMSSLRMIRPMPTGTIHASPPGGRTSREIMSKPPANIQGTAPRNIQFRPQVHSGGNRLVSVPQQNGTRSLLSGQFQSYQLTGPKGILRPQTQNKPEFVKLQGPVRQQALPPARQQAPPSVRQQAPPPVRQQAPPIPVKTTVCQMEVKGEVNKVVDVICIDDD